MDRKLNKRILNIFILIVIILTGIYSTREEAGSGFTCPKNQMHMGSMSKVHTTDDMRTMAVILPKTEMQTLQKDITVKAISAFMHPVLIITLFLLLFIDIILSHRSFISCESRIICYLHHKDGQKPRVI